MITPTKSQRLADFLMHRADSMLQATDAYMNGYECAKNEARDAYEALRQQLEAAQKDAERFAKTLAKDNPLGSDDWACAQCHPNSDILIPGFICAVHAAIAATKGTKGTI